MSPTAAGSCSQYQRGTRDQLFTRRLRRRHRRSRLPVPSEALAPFFSPDGKWIAFYRAADSLKKVAVDGGPSSSSPRPISAPASGQPTTRSSSRRTTRRGCGESPRPVARRSKLTDADDRRTVNSVTSGRRCCPTVSTCCSPASGHRPRRSRIEVYSLASEDRTVLVDGGFIGRYVASGHLLFVRGTTVMAIRFDPDRLATIGQPVPVIAGVTTDVANGIAQFSVSETGTLAFITEAALKVPRQLAWLDRTGRPSLATDTRRRFEDPTLSPDGRRVALTIRSENNADVWVHDLMRGTFERITSSPTSQFRPVWTPDGRRLFFVFEEPVFHIYSRSVDGNDDAVRIVDGPFDVFPHSVSPDGQFLVVRAERSIDAKGYLAVAACDRRHAASADRHSVPRGRRVGLSRWPSDSLRFR